MKYTYDELSTFYYPHKYVHFDHLCKTIDDRLDCIDNYLSNGYSTPDFELQKYIIADDTTCIHYIINKYDIQDWDHAIITAIICKASLTVIIHMFAAYEIRTGNDPKKLKWFDEILYVSITSNIEMFCWICQLCNIENEWVDVLKECKTDTQICDRVKQMFTWDIQDTSNPRNLLYALKNGDISSALYLIRNGAKVDVWNNYCMKLIISVQDLKSHPTLCKEMLNSGAKIPKHIISDAKKRSQQLSTIKDTLGIQKENIIEM